jgi:hypothetical protein
MVGRSATATAGSASSRIGRRGRRRTSRSAPRRGRTPIPAAATISNFGEGMTDNGPRRKRRLSRAWPARARAATAIVFTTVLALLAAACGSSPSSTGSGATSNAGRTTSSQEVAFSRCMRSGGVTNYPDPNSSGVIPKEDSQELGVTSSELQLARTACQHLLPNGGNGPNQSQIASMRALSLKFAQCMRTHGVALPDPDSSGRIPDPATVGINQGSPSFESANQACGKYRPPYMPSNAQYNAYAQTQGS